MPRPPPPPCSRARSTGSSSRRPRSRRCCGATAHGGRADRPAAADSASCASTTCSRPSTTSGCGRRSCPRSTRPTTWRRSSAPMRRCTQTGVGFFTPGTPMANDAGLGPLTGPRSIDRAKALLREAGYTNQPMRLIGPTDILAPAAMTQVAGDMFRRLGVNLDFVADRLGHGGAAARRAGSRWRGRLERAAAPAFSSFDFLDPAGHTPLRGNGDRRLAGLADHPAARGPARCLVRGAGPADAAALAREIQAVAMDELPYHAGRGLYVDHRAAAEHHGAGAGLRHLLEHEARMIGRRALLGCRRRAARRAGAVAACRGARAALRAAGGSRRAGPDRDLLQRHPQPWLHGLGHALWRGRRIPRRIRRWPRATCSRMRADLHHHPARGPEVPRWRARCGRRIASSRCAAGCAAARWGRCWPAARRKWRRSTTGASASG